MTVYFDEDNCEYHWHDLHGCTCPICLGPAEHRQAGDGYEDIECMSACGIVWLRGLRNEPEYVFDKRPDKSKKSCDRCNGLTIS